MFGADRISAELPAPRDDEPASLRQDIVDELRDHLACAFVRELHTPHSRGFISADQTTQDAAQRRVLARFGNPSSIARRLWWDTMKERTMAQRFTAIMAGIAAAGCVAAGILLWQLLQSSRADQAATLAEMRDFNAKLLAELAERSVAMSSEGANWAPVRVRLVSANDDTPVEGASVYLSGGPFGSGTDTSVTESGQSSADGFVELHSVPFGRYSLYVTAPAGGFRTSKSVLVGPDRAEPIIVQVPTTPGTITPRFEFGSPPSAAGLAFLVQLWVQPTTVDGVRWEWNPSHRQFLVDGARVMSVTGQSSESATRAGFRRKKFDLNSDAELPATALHVGDLEVVQVTARETDEQGEHIDVVVLGAFRFDSEGGANATGAADGIVQVPLPDPFWLQIDRAQVRLGIRPVPSGMQLVRLSSDIAPEIGKVGLGYWIDVVLNYQTSNATNTKTVRLLEQVQIFDLQRDETTLDPNGNPHAWLYSVYMTDEQAELVELAQSMYRAEFVLVGRRAPNDGIESVAVDPELRDRLKQEASGEAPPPNGSGA